MSNQDNPKLEIVVVEDNDDSRMMMCELLELSGFQCHTAATGPLGLEVISERRPDVALVDIGLPELDGLAATRLLAGPEVADPVPVVVVTTFDLDEYVRTAIANGASGFLLKDAGAALLVEAVRAAAAGDALVSPSVTVRFLAHFRGVRPDAPTPAAPLTEREEEVLSEVARGRTNAEIGAALHISLSTVKTRLYQGLSVLRLTWVCSARSTDRDRR